MSALDTGHESSQQTETVTAPPASQRSPGEGQPELSVVSVVNQGLPPSPLLKSPPPKMPKPCRRHPQAPQTESHANSADVQPFTPSVDGLSASPTKPSPASPTTATPDISGGCASSHISPAATDKSSPSEDKERNPEVAIERASSPSRPPLAEETPVTSPALAVTAEGAPWTGHGKDSAPGSTDAQTATPALVVTFSDKGDKQVARSVASTPSTPETALAHTETSSASSTPSTSLRKRDENFDEDVKGNIPLSLQPSPPASSATTPPPPPPPLLMGSPKKKIVKVTELLQVPEASVWGDISKKAANPLNKHHLNMFLSGHDEVDTSRDVSCATQKPLLDNARSMRVDLLLQFQSANDVLDSVEKGNHAAFKAEHLKELAALAPDQKQAARIKERTDASLSPAENFLYRLVRIPHYRQRLDIMLTHVQLPPSLRELRERLLQYRSACQRVCSNESIKNFLCWILQAVNIINNGTTEPKARGLKITSLHAIQTTRARTSDRATLLHVLVNEMNENDHTALTFANELPDVLKKATNHSYRSLKTDLQKTKTQKTDLEDAARKVEAFSEISAQLDDCLQEINPLIEDVEDVFQEVETDFKSLLNYFCEDEQGGTSIESFFESLLKLCENVQAEKNLKNGEAQNRKGSVTFGGFCNGSSTESRGRNSRSLSCSH